MSTEDNFLRLDPYNFDTEEEYIDFWYSQEKGEENDKRINGRNCRKPDTNA